MKHLNRNSIFLTFAFAFVSMVTLPNAANAQDEGGGSNPLNIGVKAGLTANYFGSAYDKGLTFGKNHTGSMPGVAAGGFLNWQLGEVFTLQPEVLYMQQGGTRVSTQQSLADESMMTTTTKNVILHNVEAPVLAKIGIGNFSGLQPQVLLGPSVGFNFAALQFHDVTTIIDETPVSGSGSEMVRSDYRSMQYGANLGVGADIPLEDFLFTFDVRYRYNVNPVNNGLEPLNLLEDAVDIHTNTFFFSIGIGF